MELDETENEVGWVFFFVVVETKLKLSVSLYKSRLNASPYNNKHMEAKLASVQSERSP
jgi:hypothetical protein